MVPHARLIRAALAAMALSAPVLAQFDNPWVTFVRDPSRIRNPDGTVATQLTNNTDEKHFAFADFNGDGWTDLVVVDKEEASVPGMRRGFLLMNENGILVDRTAQYGSDSDFPLSHGLLDLVDSRKVKVADVNGDGLLDLVTVATNLGTESANPKYISHPRIYINKGFDANGAWLGFRYEVSRIPTLTGANGQLAAPRGCSIAVGDVTGDGAPDIYMIIYHSTETGYGDNANNLAHDVLFVNNGAGFFTDSGLTRVSLAFQQGDFGTEVKFADMNGDGTLDIFKLDTLFGNGPEIAYNPPANIGFFNIVHLFNPSGAPYHIDAGDLNNDGKLDAVFSDDSADKFAFNTGNDALARVIWSPGRVFSFPAGALYGDDGFGSENHIVDLDNDGWNDVIISDVDHDVSGCPRRCHIYHNQGGTPGSTTIHIIEEMQQANHSGWKGVVGMLESDLTGSFDEAVFDIDNDGDPDMVIGRCSGAFSWINQTHAAATITPFCFGDGSGTPCPCGNGSAVGDRVGCLSSLGIGGRLVASGNANVTTDTLVLQGSQMPNSSALYFQGTTQANAGAGSVFGDGLRCAGGSVIRLSTKQNASGASRFPGAGDPAVSVQGLVLSGSTHTYQVWYRNSASFCSADTYNLTNGMQVAWAP